MRVVGGMWKGHPLSAPYGRDTRPTTDRMRESVVSMIMSSFDLDISGCSVLDAFAGSGAVGIELLSRGAAHCTFCERNRRAASVVRQNCQAIGAPCDTWAIVTGDSLRLFERDGIAGVPFSLVYLDPPYALDASAVSRLVEGLDGAGMLGSSCLVVYERAANGRPLAARGFREYRSKKHKTTSIDMLCREEHR